MFSTYSACSEVMEIKRLAIPGLRSGRIPQSKFWVNGPFDNLKNIRDVLVGAPGFEPGTSCAQERRAAQAPQSPARKQSQTRGPTIQDLSRNPELVRGSTIKGANPPSAWDQLQDDQAFLAVLNATLCS